MKLGNAACTAMLLAVAVFGCKSQKNLPQIRSEQFNNTPIGQTKEAYRIKSGDKLLISNLNWLSALFPDPAKIPGATADSGGYTAQVFDDGSINVPEIGRIHVTGSTPSKLADSLAYLYRNILRDPVFEVKVTNLRVKVLGACNIQGVVVLDKETQSLGEVLAKAGGIKFSEAGDKIQVIRGNGQQQEVITYDFQQLGDPKIMNLAVYDNDIIYIPPSKEGIRSVRLSRKLILIQPVLIALNLAILVINLTK